MSTAVGNRDAVAGLPGSFKDPAGRVLRLAGELVRAVYPEGRSDYELLVRSGLYDRLVDRRLLVSHEELPQAVSSVPAAWNVLRPVSIPFISYASEWSFSQLRDAAIATLRVQQEALAFGMTLKDAPSSNIQFLDGRPVLIDTLSLTKYQGGPWTAYYQFCKHFLAPLLLIAYRDARLLDLLARQPDGMPLDLASALLPIRSWLKPAALMHVHLHARADRRLQAPAAANARAAPGHGRRADVLVESLLAAVGGLGWQPSTTQWTTYADCRPTYSEHAWQWRRDWVNRHVQRVVPRTVWDFGAAAGHMSRLCTDAGAFTVACDADAACVDAMYREARASGNTRLLPLVINLLAPPAPSGWAEQERLGLVNRGPADLLLALGVVHHLAVPGAVPFDQQLRFFARLARGAIVEYVPPDDPVVTAWANRFDVRHVTEQAFQDAARAAFSRIERFPIPESRRVLYSLGA
jgi:hypothetical protein